ncbi:hypothetical protein RchiOBHm_Chr1g0328621 [Rosa chinensis]|uniref:Uncharacterized protein n=1 Tax=Rosa chinensis TaxID=74649 RepID=A0A2P6SAV1_ROSCH|nr:hypothetical protein RchiOBHm_Chr1g0328621 [Rosa chinensis]
MPRSTFTSLILTQLPLSFSIPSSSFSTILHHTCARPWFIYRTLHLRIAAKPILHRCLWMLPDQWRCVARWSPPSRWRSYVFWYLYPSFADCSGMDNDGGQPLASGSEVLADVTPSATWRLAAMPADLLEAVLCDSRSRVVGLLGLGVLFSVGCRLIKLLFIGLLGLGPLLPYVHLLLHL